MYFVISIEKTMEPVNSIEKKTNFSVLYNERNTPMPNPAPPTYRCRPLYFKFLNKSQNKCKSSCIN